MTLLNTEVAVVGGGMVGGALALGLAQQGFDVTVIEQAAPPVFDPASQPDVRISAISASSVDLLRGLGVWEAVLAMRAHPYSRLETREWENAHVSFDAAELKLPRLGYMVENNVLQQALWQALEAHPKVTLRVPDSLKALHRHEGGYLLTLDNDDELAVKLVVGADGANSQVRQMAGIGIHAWQYQQSCMLITVQSENAPGESTGSILRRTARMHSYRCLITGLRWCGTTSRRAFDSCRGCPWISCSAKSASTSRAVWVT